jgi:hypothetical protein
MNRPLHSLSIFIGAGALAGALLVGPTVRIAAQTKPAGTTAAPKPWPDAKTLEKRRADAQARKLFASPDPLPITLTANFKAVQSDRNPESTKTFPASLTFLSDAGAPVTVALEIRTRGHARRSFNTCDFAPLRLEFTKAQVKGTVFDDQRAIKLGTHCREGVKVFEQYVMREYAAYRIYNLITPQSFRARLAKVTYVDAASKKTLATRFGLFIEDDDDVAERNGGRITSEQAALVRLDRDAFTRMTLFEYMIGNLDMSLVALHNIRLLQVPAGTVYPVPYDFDYSGLADTTYSQPPPGLGVTTVKDRVFRGPCRTDLELAPFLEQFRGIRPELRTLYDSLPEMDAGSKDRALKYLDGFYKTLDDPASVKKAFLNNPPCLKRGLM